MAEMHMPRQEFVATLRRTGHAELADKALRVLPDSVDEDQIAAFLRPYGVTMDEVISEMGGSP